MYTRYSMASRDDRPSHLERGPRALTSGSHRILTHALLSLDLLLLQSSRLHPWYPSCKTWPKIGSRTASLTPVRPLTGRRGEQDVDRILCPFCHGPQVLSPLRFYSVTSTRIASRCYYGKHANVTSWDTTLQVHVLYGVDSTLLRVVLRTRYTGTLHPASGPQVLPLPRGLGCLETWDWYLCTLHCTGGNKRAAQPARGGSGSWRKARTGLKC